MFSDIKSISTERLIEIKTFIELIKRLEPPIANIYPTEIAAMKGLFFVQIYGAFEYTLTSIIQRTIEEINKTNITLNQCKPIILSMALNPDLDSLYEVGEMKKWEKRWNLFDKFEGDSILNIANNIFPTNGQNIRHNQLASIWKTFDVQSAIFPENSLGGRITEIVNHRNSIAHGNNSSSEIGSRVTINDIDNRYDEMSRYFTYLFGIFEIYINTQQFKV